MDFHLQPGYFVKNEIPIKDGYGINQGLILQINKINGNQIDLGVKEILCEYITLKAFQFPFINVLWLEPNHVFWCPDSHVEADHLN